MYKRTKLGGKGGVGEDKGPEEAGHLQEVAVGHRQEAAAGPHQKAAAGQRRKAAVGRGAKS